MGSRKTRDIKASLAGKGFVPEQRDHSYFFLYVGDRKSSIRTKVSHGIKEYSSNLLSLMARQLHLSNKQLGDLLDCPLRYEEYLSILQEKRKLQL